MPKGRRKAEPVGKRRRPPAQTPEGRENQLISLATKLAEQQLIDGTASAAVITHYLKLGSTREKLEQENIAKKNSLLSSQKDALESAKKTEELYRNALNAMRSYAGQDDPPEEEAPPDD